MVRDGKDGKEGRGGKRKRGRGERDMYLVGELLCKECILYKQDDGVVCNDCHEPQQHYPEQEPRLLQGRRDACKVKMKVKGEKELYGGSYNTRASKAPTNSCMHTVFS